ncbi:Glutamate--tRNA ligase 2 [Alphaproteobacteria bacterium]
MIITRFAPSPTGYLHIGGARTALFNWLYSRKYKGKFYLRIEDTDQLRSTSTAVNAIIEGLKWLGLNWDDDIVFQSRRQSRHLEVAEQLVKLGKAYYCYLTHKEIGEFRKNNPYSKLISPWRDNNKAGISEINPVIRLRIDEAKEGIILNDMVQGVVKVNSQQLDDMILVRSDGAPTYMLAVVVDDSDMGVTHVIRGDDHLTNTFRQMQIYNALGWTLPRYAHIPLIYGSDGTKLSKRHGAVGLDHYRNTGYLPETMCNYLLRLGWGGEGNTEIISMKEACILFDICNVSKSPARFDLAKLNHLNAHYINIRSEEDLTQEVIGQLGISKNNAVVCDRISKGMKYIKVRAKTLIDLATLANLFITPQNPVDEKSAVMLADKSTLTMLNKVVQELQIINVWKIENIKNSMLKFAENYKCATTHLMQALRAATIGTFNAPAVYEMMEILGKEESISRILNIL